MTDALAIEMPLGLPGITDDGAFQLRPRGKGSAYVWLEHTRDPSLVLLAIDVLRLRPDYPVDQVRRGLGFLHLDPDEPLIILALCTAPAEPEAATANLLAPIGVGKRSGRAAQIVLHDARWSDRAPLGT